MIKKIKRIIHQSIVISKDNEGNNSKPALHLMFDLIRWTLKNRGHISSFFFLGLNHKNKNLSEYLDFRSFNPNYKKFYPPSYLCLLEDKLVFEKFINNYPEYAPKNIGSVTKYHLYLADALPQPVENILKYPMKCIVKNTWGFGGKDVFLLTVDSGELFINGIKSTLKEFINRLPQKAILQELLEQHEIVKKLHPSSINTSRIVTVNTGTKVHVISTYLRMGVGGSIVDNIAKGNIFVHIDKETGKLSKTGYSNNEPLIFFSHPQTKQVFEGIELPHFQEAKEICKKLHYELPYFFILGWDIAFTPKGPVVIESNNIHRIVDEQRTEGALKKQFDVYVKEFLENKHKERKLNYA